MEELRIFFLGITDFSLKQSSSIWINLSMNSQFKLDVEAQSVDSIGISYIIMAFVQCGTCDGYPYVYNNVCSRECPQGYQNSGGFCVPTQNCGSGYVRNPQTNNCVPRCATNEQWTGNSCSCIEGFNLIGGVCQKCPFDSYFNYLKRECVSLCGPYADYNAAENLCYCHTGYYVVDGVCGECDTSVEVYNEQTQHCDSKYNQCGAGKEWTVFGCQCLPGYTEVPSTNTCILCNGNMVWNSGTKSCECPSGQQWSFQQDRCIPITQNCGANEYYNGNRCVCDQGFNRIGGVCKKCPPNSVFDPLFGFCNCINGYSLKNGACISNAPQCQGQNERLFNGRCECLPGYTRHQSSLQCIPNCPPNMHYNIQTNICDCDTGYERRSDGRCYGQSCPDGQRFNTQTNRCESICNVNLGQYWDPARQGCASCLPGYQWNVYRTQCIPITQYCQSGYVWDPYQNSCVPRCTAQHQIWNGQKCVCKSGYTEISPNVCIPAGDPCNRNGQQNERFVNGVCVCIELYVRRNGFCVC